MMKKAVVYIVALICCSCNSWLDIQPKLEVGQEELFSTEDGFNDALTGCYALLKAEELYGKSLTITTLEYMAQHWVSGGSTDALRRYNYQDDYVKSLFQSVYNGLYNVIAQANDIIEHLDRQGMDVIKDQETVNRLKGEALAIRAFCHFDLLRIFGQVPLAEATITAALPYAEVASEERVPAYDFATYTGKLVQDLNEAERLLGESDPVTEYTYAELNDPVKLWGGDSDRGFRRLHFNYWAVKALKARYYLYVGDADNAYQSAKEVIDGQVHGEKVIDLAMATDMNNRAYTLPSETLMALHSYDMGDRLESDFEGTSALSAADSRDDLYWDIFEQESSDLRYQLFTEQVLTSSGGGIKVILRKYLQDDSGLGLEGNQSVSADNNFVTMQMMPLIRLAEMYLIAVETAPTLTEANSLMTTFKASRNLVHTEYISRNEIPSDVLNQYQREFWGEGQMFFQYKRLKSETIQWTIVAPILESYYVMPLPDGEY